MPNPKKGRKRQPATRAAKQKANAPAQTRGANLGAELAALYGRRRALSDEVELSWPELYRLRDPRAIRRCVMRRDYPGVHHLVNLGILEPGADWRDLRPATEADRTKALRLRRRLAAVTCELRGMGVYAHQPDRRMRIPELVGRILARIDAILAEAQATAPALPARRKPILRRLLAELREIETGLVRARDASPDAYENDRFLGQVEVALRDALERLRDAAATPDNLRDALQVPAYLVDGPAAREREGPAGIVVELLLQAAARLVAEDTKIEGKGMLPVTTAAGRRWNRGLVAHHVYARIARHKAHPARARCVALVAFAAEEALRSTLEVPSLPAEWGAWLGHNCGAPECGSLVDSGRRKVPGCETTAPAWHLRATLDAEPKVFGPVAPLIRDLLRGRLDPRKDADEWTRRLADVVDGTIFAAAEAEANGRAAKTDPFGGRTPETDGTLEYVSAWCTENNVARSTVQYWQKRTGRLRLETATAPGVPTFARRDDLDRLKRIRDAAKHVSLRDDA